MISKLLFLSPYFLPSFLLFQVDGWCSQPDENGAGRRRPSITHRNIRRFIIARYWHIIDIVARKDRRARGRIWVAAAKRRRVWPHFGYRQSAEAEPSWAWAGVSTELQNSTVGKREANVRTHWRAPGFDVFYTLFTYVSWKKVNLVPGQQYIARKRERQLAFTWKSFEMCLKPAETSR